MISSVEKNIDQKDVSLEAKCSEMLMNYKKKYAIGAAATGLASQLYSVCFLHECKKLPGGQINLPLIGEDIFLFCSF